MKTKRNVLLAIVLIIGTFCNFTYAQSHIDAVIKKCETLESIEMNVVKNKREGNNEEHISIRISNNPKLVEEFLNAFNKDGANADQSTTRRKDNREFIEYRFNKSVYSITVQNKKDARVLYYNSPRARIAYGVSRPIEGLKRLNIDSTFTVLSKTNWDSIMAIQSIKIDSLAKHSLKTIKAINWDSIASNFAKQMDSAAAKWGSDWEDFYWEYNQPQQ